MRRIDIGTRIHLAVMIPMVLIAVTLTWYFMAKSWLDLEEAEQQRASTIAYLLVPVSEHALFANNPDDVRQLQQQINSLAKDVMGIAAIAVSRVNGELVAINGPLSQDELVYAPMRLDENIIKIPVSAPPPLQLPPNELYHLDDPRFAPSSSKLLGYVLVKIDRQRIEKEKRKLATGAFILLLCGLVVWGGIAWYLGRGVSRPILELTNIATEIERGNLKVRASIATSGALQVLGRAINQMAIALDNSNANMLKRIHDATAQLQAQKELAEQANRTKTQVMAAISHDMRQPLQALGLSIHSLKQRVTNPDNEKILLRIERSLFSLENVLNDIAQLDPNMHDFPVMALFDSLSATFGNLAEEYGLQLRFAPCTAWCRSDRALLERILANLVSNALRYTSVGGVVVGCRYRGAIVRFEVWDSGQGIPAEKKNEIFREFVRIEPMPHGRAAGRGLGLAIVDRLCKLLAHPVECRSEPGVGSVFSVDVPRASRTSIQASGTMNQDDSPNWVGKNIIVVDDDAQILASLRDIFEMRGANVSCAATLQEVLQLQFVDAKAPPALIVSDFYLPDGNGVEVVKTVRQLAGVAVPAVIVSGDMGISMGQSLMEEGIPFLRKPVNIEALWEAIRMCGAVASEATLRRDD